MAMFLIRYGELALKSPKVRKRFEKQLLDNIHTHFAHHNTECMTSHDGGRIYLKTGDEKTAEVKSSQTEILLKESVPLKYYPTSVYYNLYSYYITIGDTSIALQYLSSANDEIHDHLKFISNSDDKNTYMKKNIMYSKIVDLYAKYFTNKQKE